MRILILILILILMQMTEFTLGVERSAQTTATARMVGRAILRARGARGRLVVAVGSGGQSACRNPVHGNAFDEIPSIVSNR